MIVMFHPSASAWSPFGAIIISNGPFWDSMTITIVNVNVQCIHDIHSSFRFLVVYPLTWKHQTSKLWFWLYFKAKAFTCISLNHGFIYASFSEAWAFVWGQIHSPNTFWSAYESITGIHVWFEWFKNFFAKTKLITLLFSLHNFPIA